MIEVAPAAQPADLDAVRALMRGFIAWHRVRHHAYLDLVDAYFDAAAFEAELAGLPGAYAAPRGALLLARWRGQAAGCVALRPLDGPPGESCEMKRMFVATEHQGRGLGRALAVALLEAARAAGYRRMQLDTGQLQTEALALYRSQGFAEMPSPPGVPAALRDALVFMQRTL